MIKNRKIKKSLRWIVAAVAFVAVIVGGVIIARNKVSGKAVSVFPVSSMAYFDMGENRTAWGEVTDSAMQEVRLGSGLVDSVKVKVGTKVKKGDTLMKYNKESVKLAVQADEAAIALLEAQMESAKAEIAHFQSLRPSEEMPEPVEQVIHHSAKPVTTLSLIDVGTAPSDGESYFCTMDTKVTAGFLQYLDDSDQTAEFLIYDNNVQIGSWFVDGTKISSGSKIIYITEEKEPDDPVDPIGPNDPEDSGASKEQNEVSPAVQQPSAPLVKETRREEQGPYEDWILGEGVEFNGDGTVSVDYSIKHYGKLLSVVPEEAEWDETVIIDPGVDISGDNYAYSRKELAEMVEEKSKGLKDQELSLKAAKLKLKEDKLISTDGKVRANMDGVVTEVKDPNEVKTGESLITVKGTGGFTITAQISEYDIRDMQIGDVFQVQTYESASAFMAEVSHISTEPSDSSMYGGQDVTYYAVTATAMDEELDLRRGEGCEIMIGMPGADSDSANALVLPTMLVRKDAQGSYCMIADENDRLKRADVQTGRVIWGDSIEIKSGLTQEDRIAFPYGKHVKEGSPVVDKDNIYDEF